MPGGCFHRPERVALALVRDPWPTQPTQPTIRAPPSLNFVDLRKSHHRKLWEEELDLTIHDVATILLQSSPALLVHISAHSAARTTKLRAGTSSDLVSLFLSSIFLFDSSLTDTHIFLPHSHLSLSDLVQQTWQALQYLQVHHLSSAVWLRQSLLPPPPISLPLIVQDHLPLPPLCPLSPATARSSPLRKSKESH